MVTLTQLSQVSSINLGFLAGNTSHCHRKTSYLRISRKNGRWFRLFSGTSAQLQDWDCSHDSRKIAPLITPVDEKPKKLFKKEHHLWMKRDSAGSSQKALNLVRIVSRVSNEKEAIYVALDEWAAWETEFPVIAAAKALGILRKRRRWLRVIQVFADMEELGVKPDQDSVRRVARAFQQLGEEEKQKQVLQKYGLKLKYIHFNGERVRIKAGENWDE
ncbi:pentatricopeptide repeat-containing protein At4g18975, chloroplastic isoform X2 [Amborella trichopoda]|uniref:pentatricopeptide repeat-containing protein At4g18975, chloroplastic isoform X2 n=1 Tax=Amborella trichopoda TaxID=13333 RepID=UPI0009C02064|nr:pentatricopeptide repeat-containing protein At4g18975, chloroplastic isoform X2 [Amborella trichopoda]|eukprot:XP_020525151.1 pentatricopeptide repeat-containing protein At4g18975, chloroplastic isoform X2 [Amborella trichopoda]